MNDEELIELVTTKIARTVTAALCEVGHFDFLLNGRYGEELTRALETDIAACVTQDVELAINTAKTTQYNAISEERGELVRIIKHARELRRRGLYEDDGEGACKLGMK